ISPGSVDTSGGTQTVTVTARITDDVAGVFASQTDCLPGNPPGTCNFSGSYINLRSPSGGQSVGGSFTTRLSGDTLDGLYQATITLPAYSEQGTWTVDPVGL